VLHPSYFQCCCLRLAYRRWREWIWIFPGIPEDNRNLYSGQGGDSRSGVQISSLSTAAHTVTLPSDYVAGLTMNSVQHTFRKELPLLKPSRGDLSKAGTAIKGLRPSAYLINYIDKQLSESTRFKAKITTRHLSLTLRLNKYMLFPCRPPVHLIQANRDHSSSPLKPSR
jgi:hypothetical protein